MYFRMVTIGNMYVYLKYECFTSLWCNPLSHWWTYHFTDIILQCLVGRKIHSFHWSKCNKLYNIKLWNHILVSSSMRQLVDNVPGILGEYDYQCCSSHPTHSRREYNSSTCMVWSISQWAIPNAQYHLYLVSFLLYHPYIPHCLIRIFFLNQWGA